MAAGTDGFIAILSGAYNAGKTRHFPDLDIGYVCVKAMQDRWKYKGICISRAG